MAEDLLLRLYPTHKFVVQCTITLDLKLLSFDLDQFDRCHQKRTQVRLGKMQ